MTRLFACLLLMLLAAPLMPQSLKLVVQTAGRGAFDVAGWTPDGQWVVEASGHERLVRIWDPKSGIVVDSIRLPLPGKQPGETLLLQSLVVDAQGRRARIKAISRSWDEDNPIDYDVDLLARRATPVPTSRTLDQAALARQRFGETDDEDPDAGRPALPVGPDGTQLVRGIGGVFLLDREGEETGQFTFGEPVQTNWASLSPDGSKVVFLSWPPQQSAAAEDEGAAGETVSEETDAGEADAEEADAGEADGLTTNLVVLNIATGKASGSGAYGQSWINYGDYSRVGWLGDGRLIISVESSAYNRDRKNAPDEKGEPRPAWLMDVVGKREPFEVEPRCYIQPLGPDRLVGAGLAACRRGVRSDNGIWVRPLEGDWVRLNVAAPARTTVDGLRASPDGRRIAISFGRRKTAVALVVVNAETGETEAELRMTGPMVTAFDFLPDSDSLIALGSDAARHWRFAEGKVDPLPVTDFDPSMIASDGHTLLFGGIGSPSVERLRLGGREPDAPLDVVAPVAGGFMPGKPIFWVGTFDGELKLFDTRDWSLIATVQRFHNGEDEYFLVHDPAGRYDSNLPPDYAPFRWLVMDAPFQSLSPQTFMRELYTPDLLSRLLECVPQRTCEKALPVAPDMARLNRVLPEVTGIAVTPGVAPGLVDVAVTVREGVNSLPSAAYDKARSGMHNLRLFRDGVLVAEAGAADQALDRGDRAAWRRATRLPPNGPEGVHVARFPGVRLPTGPREEPVAFSAYAFNEDRVRGEETSQEVPLPASATAPRPRRLFLVSIGVDAYPGGLFRPLRYAVADARAMAELFTGAFMHPADGRPVTVVRIRIEGTAGKPATRAEIAGAFERLRAATPDDLVIISFSGHGFTDATGRFALVPSDVRTVGDRPLWESMIGADDLARWLTPVDAGHIYLVIDACHSAASVMAGGFKPGPMGDPGLGQLAYDKGIRILSASAPDQYAMESTSLGHGLLTYALVVKGARDGKADADNDKVVTLGELLAFAVDHLPVMQDPTNPAEGPGLVVEWPGPPVARQTPKLFDFHPTPSPIAVRSDLAGLAPATDQAQARP